MTDLLTLGKAIQRELIKQVFKVPLKGEGSERWKHHEASTLFMEHDAYKNRLFAVEVDVDQTLDLQTIGDTTTDYETVYNVAIAYSTTDLQAQQANNDYTQFKHQLFNVDTSALSALGFNFWRLDVPILEDSESEKFKILIIPVVCRVTIDL